MSKSESKFRNCAIKMNNALLSLLETRNFHDLSIRDICEAAGVNRSTFYAHYADTYELLQETHWRLIKNFLDSVRSTVPLAALAEMTAAELASALPQYISLFLKFVRERKTVFRVYNTSGAFDLREAERLLTQVVFLPVFAKNGITDPDVGVYMAKFYISGVSAITLEWIRRDCDADIPTVCNIILRCIYPSAVRA